MSGNSESSKDPLAAEGWIPVTERLPQPGEVVLRYGIAFQICFFPDLAYPYIDRGELVNKDGFRWADWGVTHWQPIPVVKTNIR